MFEWINKFFPKRYSLDNPANWSRLGNDDLEYNSAAGIAVTSQSATSLPTVDKAVRLISNDIAEMAWMPMKRIQGGKQALTSHLAYRLLNVRPNSTMFNPFEFKRCLIKDVLLEGNGYAFITRLNNGNLDELVYLDASRVMPRKTASGVIYSVYIYDGSGAQIKKDFPAESILHFRGIGSDIQGASLVARARDSLALGIAMQRYQAAYFANAPTAKGFIKHPGKLTEVAQEKLRENFMKHHSGPGNAHKPGVLVEGADFIVPKMASPVDSELSALREQEIIQIANWFSIPPHKLGSSKNVSYNSLEIEQQAYVDDAISPICAQIESECYAKLYNPDEGDNLFYLDTDKLIRPPRNERYSAAKTAIESGFKSPGEIRNEENLNPVPALNEYYISNNVQPINLEEETPTEDVQTTALNGAQVASLVAIVQTVTSGEVEKESGKALIAACFPTLTKEQINAIIDPLEVSEDEPASEEPPGESEAGAIDTNDDNAQQSVPSTP